MQAERVIRVVFEALEVDHSEAETKFKPREISDARHISAKILFDQGMKPVEIAKKLNRHRTSPYFGIQKVAFLIKHDREFREKYQKCITAIKLELNDED